MLGHVTEAICPPRTGLDIISSRTVDVYLIRISSFYLWIFKPVVIEIRHTLIRFKNIPWNRKESHETSRHNFEAMNNKPQDVSLVILISYQNYLDLGDGPVTAMVDKQPNRGSLEADFSTVQTIASFFFFFF